MFVEANMMSSPKSTRWILLVVAIIVLAGMGTAGWIWYADYRTWHNSNAAPLFAQIDPADGATVYESEMWIHWNSSAHAKGRVLWRKVGGLRVQAADAGSGQEMLAHLAELSPGSKYEYIVEETNENQTRRSPVRTLSVTSGISLEAVADQTVAHDYDQSVKLTVHNRGSKPVTVTARALKQFDDLPSDITGYGSIDVPGEVAPNGTLDLRLAVTAADAAQETYEIPIEAAGAYVSARIHVHIPKFSLNLKVISEDPKTLAKTVEIKNNGDALADLSIRPPLANQLDVVLQPAIGHASLAAGGTLRVVISPVLYLEFESLKTQIEAAAAGQTTQFPLEFKVPQGTHLIAFRSASTTSSAGGDWYCTNKPNTCSWMPGPQGNGPAVGGGGDGAVPENPGVQQAAKIRPAIRWPPKRALPNELSLGSPQLLTAFERRPWGEQRSGEDHLQLVSETVGLTVSFPVNDFAQMAGSAAVGPSAGTGNSSNQGQQSCSSCAEKLEMAMYKLQDAQNQYFVDLKYNADAGTEDSDYRKLAQAENDLSALSSDCCPRCDLPPITVGNQTLLCQPASPNRAPCRYGPDDCEQAAKRIRDEYRALGKALNNPNTALPALDLAEQQQWRQLLQNLGNDLQKAWDALKSVCSGQGIDIGSLTGNEPTIPMSSSTSDQQANKGEYQRLASVMKSFATDENVAFAASVLTHAGLDLATEGVSEAVIAAAVSDIGEAYDADESVQSWNELADSWQQLADKDPPSSEYMEEVKVVLPGQAVPPSADSLQYAGWSASQERRRAIAYLKAFFSSYERYQGALTAKNETAMLLQARAMFKFADQGLEASRSAALKSYERDRELLHQLDQAQQALSKKGLSWNSLVDAYRDRVFSKHNENKVNPLPPPEQLARFPSQLRARVRSIEAVQAHLPSSIASATWPEPADLLGFEMLRRTARILESSAMNGGSDQAPLAVPTRPPRLVDALQRRASFTRLQRGALASEWQGNSYDSSAYAAVWYTDKRIDAVWHQSRDQVLFAAFDSAGKLALAPQVIGRGRWPRLAADGDRVAVSWGGPDGNSSIVRLNDGKQWGKEIQLPGREAAIVFAAGGPLHAATSTGVWKLTGDHFDHVQEADYSQPAIAIDKEGKAHVASKLNGQIVYDGGEMGEGERPSLVIAPDGTVSLAYLSKGSVVVRSGKGGQWTPPDVVVAKNPSWPTLALDSKGAVRLSYIGPADYGPDALWLVRLPDKQPLLMPSLAGNVMDAWFTVKFDLRQARNNYRPHDVLLTVNDVWVKMFENTVPDGRYLFRLSPNQIFTSPGQPVPNRVAINSWHVNPGHYMSNSEYELIARTAWSEHYVFAANENDARIGNTSERINHDQPDLGIYANAVDLPVEMPKPGRLDVPILIANLGEAASAPTQLLMLGKGGAVLATAAVPSLQPGTDQTIKMPFDYDGKLTQLEFRFDKNVDFNPSNDSLSLTLWEPPPTSHVATALPPPDSTPTAADKVPLELTVTIAGQPVAKYRIVDASTERTVATVVNGEQFGRLPSGSYRIALQQYPFEGQEVLFTDNIQHQSGVPQTVPLNSGIEFDVQSAGNPWSWSAVDAANPAKVVQSQSSQHSFMALPAGEYQVSTKPTQFDSQPVLWPQKIQVQPGQPVAIKLDSGVRLDMAQDLGPLFQWWLVRPEKPDQAVQRQNGDQRAMLVPAGEYQVATQPTRFDSQPVLWPQKIQVQSGQPVTIKLDSGVRLDMAQDLGPLFQWWLVRPEKPDQAVQHQNGDQRAMLLPAGEYQVATKPTQFDSQSVLWPQKIQVQPGQPVVIKLDSGVRLDMAQNLGPLFQWWLVRPEKPDQAVQRQNGDQRAMLVPAGEYQVATKPTQFDSQPVLWPQKIQVQSGQQLTFKASSGVRMIGPPGAGTGFEYQLLDDQKKSVQNGPQAWNTQALPPGTYSLQMRRQFGQWKTVAEQVHVTEGQVTEVRISQLPTP
jgi:hypothetical protein